MTPIGPRSFAASVGARSRALVVVSRARPSEAPEPTPPPTAPQDPVDQAARRLFHSLTDAARKARVKQMSELANDVYKSEVKFVKKAFAGPATGEDDGGDADDDDDPVATAARSVIVTDGRAPEGPAKGLQ